MYKIRIESIGGLGANLIGKLLGQIGFEYLNKYSRSFSGYGSEKKGSPVKSHIYFSDSKIRTNTPVKDPDMAVYFTDNIDLTGYRIKENTDVIVNYNGNFCDLKVPNCRLWLIDAVKYARECHSRVNMVILGAIARVSGFISLDNCISVVKNNLVTNGNIEALKCGYNNVNMFEIKDSKYNCNNYDDIERYTEIGGINLSNGSAITNDLQGCREGLVPDYIRERCIDCGLCESTCPDMVFQFKDGVNLGMDLYHCKGCLRCCEICPVNALVPVEKGGKNIGNIHLINKKFSFDNTGYSSFVEGEAYSADGTTDKSI